MNRQRRAALAVAGLTILGGFLRFYHLGTNSLWADEILTLSTASRPLSEVMYASFSQNNVPPLYFWLSHLALESLGQAEASLRFLSALSGMLTVPLFYLLVMEITAGEIAASLSASMLAVNPLHIWFSQEARPYALLTLIGCAALWSLARSLRRGGVKAWALFGCLTWLGILTHLIGIGLLVVAWTWALLWPAEIKRIRALAGVTLVVTLLALPVIISLGSSAAGAHAPPRQASLMEVPYALFTYVAGYSFGPAPREIQNLGPLAALRANLFQAAISGGMLAALGILILAKVPRRALLFWALLVAPLTLAVIGSRISEHPFNVRYTLMALLGFLGLAGWAMSELPWRYRWTAAAGVLSLFLWSDCQWFAISRYWKEDTRGAIAWLAGHLRPEATVAVAPAYMTGALTYYARREGVELRIVPLESGSSLLMAGRLDGMAITREHHVPQARLLERAFISQTGSAVVEGEVTGYRLFASSK